MVYTEVLPKIEMRRRARDSVRGLVILVGAAALLTGCATYDPVVAYHHYEGGAIAHNPPPAPGLHDKFPNLASVPAKPPVLSPKVQQAVRQQLQAVNAQQNAIKVPGASPVVPDDRAPPPVVTPPAVLIGFQHDRAILSHRDRDALKALIAQRMAAPRLILLPIVAMGFAPVGTPAGLRLALLRATAIANALTEAGVPASAIRIEALTAGRGGAAQLLYTGAT